MPEVERFRDPIGANRGKTLKQHAGSISAKVKQHLHNKYYIPPYRATNRNWEITFASLGWKRRTIQKFWRLFCQINVSRDGAIKLEEFLEFFDLDWTPWTERCFTYFDTTGGGDVDFLEFMISVWNVCTFKIDTLSNFAFDMYDMDSDGELSIPEIEKMVEELYGEKGGRQCLNQATQYAEERGGALSLNSFIAFTSTHQLLFFPMFVIQQKLQRRVFGRRYWESMDRKTKNQKIFNPRHVQILLRTYQTGGAAAVLSHTGDPNKGLRDWYENQKQNDIDEDIPEEERRGLQRWKSVRSTVQSKVRTSAVMKQQTLQKMKSFKAQTTRRSKINRASNAASGVGHQPSPSAPPRNSVVDDTMDVARPSSASAPPPDVAEALKTIRAKRASTPGKDRQPPEPSARPGSASAPPPDVADALKKIRAKRASTPGKDNSDSRPGSASAPPPDVAEALKTIRARRASTSGGENDHIEPPGGRPGSASAPASDVAEALKSIRAKRSGTASKNDTTEADTKAKPKRKTRHRRRTGSAVQTNVRQRQAGTMFVPTGQTDGWLK